MKRSNVLIVGGGVAGMACALWARRLGLSVTICEAAGQPGGQLNLISWPIADLPGVTVSGPELRDRCVMQVRERGVTLTTETPVVDVDLVAKTVTTADRVLHGRFVVIATGGQRRRLGVPGEAEMIARGELFRGSLDGHRMKGDDVVVVGGGDRAVENAILLARSGAHVALVHRRKTLRARSQIAAMIDGWPIAQHRETVVRRIVGSRATEAVELERHDGEVQTVPCRAVLPYVGLEPSTALVASQLMTDDDGRICCSSVCETSVADTFAIGDVAAPSQLSSIATSYGHAMAAAKTMAIRCR